METAQIRKKILLVEDDPYIRDIYGRELVSAGFEVDVAVDGKEGAAKITQGDFDLLLLDIMLPMMNGLDLLKKVKEDEKTKSKPVVILTNLAQDQTIKDAFDMGADGYITKSSMTTAEVVQEVKNKLNGK